MANEKKYTIPLDMYWATSVLIKDPLSWLIAFMFEAELSTLAEWEFIFEFDLFINRFLFAILFSIEYLCFACY